MNTDVLIVGAGPTGLALACQLIRYGIHFVIIDKKETTTPHSRALGVQARTLEIYEQIGLADKLISLGHSAEKVRLVESGKVRGEAVLKEMGKGMSPYPFLLLIEQGKHEQLLYEYIKDNGSDVLWNTEMTSLAQDESGVTVQFSDGKSIRAKYLVGCDGAKSPVRHALGLTFEGDTVGRLFYVADVEIDWDYGHDGLVINLGKDNLTAFFPMVGDRRWRIVGTFPEGHKKDADDILYDEIERQIETDMGVKLDITRVHWFSVYNVHSRAVEAFSRGRCFVAGDAAHIHTPAGAQGMNTGIQDGYNLAWKLSAVIKGDASLRFLETYNEERLPNARRLLKTTDRFFEFGTSDAWFISFVRTHIFPHVFGFALTLDVVKNAIFPLVSQIGINYRGSSLSKNDGDFTVQAGDRMPYFKIDGESIYDSLHEPKFHLLTFGRERFDGELRENLTVRNLPLHKDVAKIFGVDKPFVVLVRPDNYIGLMSNAISTDVVKDYMATSLTN
jgi:2-polyprenyl-6-methoxyphenol hydroxylase-like FAD-dependent oxidoreductase